MDAHAAVLEALIARGITGEGCSLEVSLFSGAADWMNVPLLYFEGTGRVPQRVGLAHPSICPYGAFPTADESLVLISIQNEREWRASARWCWRSPTSRPPRVMPQHRPGGQPGDCRPAHRRDPGEADPRCGGGPAEGSRHRLRLRQHPGRSRDPSGAAPGRRGDAGGTAHIVAPPVLVDGQTRALGPVPEIGQHSTAVRAEFTTR